MAALVDAAVVILAVAVVIGLGVAAAIAYARVRGEDGEDDADQDEDEDEEDVSLSGSRGDGGGLDSQHDRPRATQHKTAELLQSPRLRAALQGAGTGLAVARRNWRSPGFRVVGLRRVDVRTGGPVGIRSALIGVLFDQARQAATGQLFRSRARRERDRMSELQPKLKEIEREYAAADRQARQRAMMEFYEANKVNPLASCIWPVAGPIISQVVLAIGIRRGRTVYDRLTGTIVVSDR